MKPGRKEAFLKRIHAMKTITNDDNNSRGTASGKIYSRYLSEKRLCLF